jgi:hypothetical protein
LEFAKVNDWKAIQEMAGRMMVEGVLGRAFWVVGGLDEIESGRVHVNRRFFCLIHHIPLISPLSSLTENTFVNRGSMSFPPVRVPSFEHGIRAKRYYNTSRQKTTPEKWYKTLSGRDDLRVELERRRIALVDEWDGHKKVLPAMAAEGSNNRQRTSDSR